MIKFNRSWCQKKKKNIQLDSEAKTPTQFRSLGTETPTKSVFNPGKVKNALTQMNFVIKKTNVNATP